MGFTFTEEQTLIQKTAATSRTRSWRRALASSTRPRSSPRSSIPKLTELGFMGIISPEAYGGSALSQMTQVLIMEELHRACAATGVTVSVAQQPLPGPDQQVRPPRT